MRTVLCVAAVALALSGCNTSNNYFQDEVDASARDQDTSLFGSMLTMAGVIPPQREAIKHTPRAPIAIPGTNELPEPGSGASVEAAVGFPEDQDDANERQRSALRASLAGPDYLNDAVRENSNAQLTPETMQLGRREGGGLRRRGVEVNQDPWGNKSANATRQELDVVVRTASPGGEVLNEDGTAAPRKYLIQPPTTYRTPADTAPLPERKEIEHSRWVKDRLYDVEDKTPRRLRD